MRLPRDVSGESLAAGLESLGYRVTRQKGSHIRLTTFENGEHHVRQGFHGGPRYNFATQPEPKQEVLAVDWMRRR
jgi:predicted RNA binding protein YcfA (HicA-like mRNA interferase family)